MRPRALARARARAPTIQQNPTAWWNEKAEGQLRAECEHLSNYRRLGPEVKCNTHREEQADGPKSLEMCNAAGDVGECHRLRRHAAFATSRFRKYPRTNHEVQQRTAQQTKNTLDAN